MNCKSAGSSLVRTEPHGTGRYQTKEITGSQYLNSFRTLSLLCVSPCMFAPFSEQDPMFPLKRKVICHTLPDHGVLSIVGTYEVVRVVAVIKNTVMEFLLSPFAFFLMVLDKQLILYFYVCLLQNIKSPQSDSQSSFQFQWRLKQRWKKYTPDLMYNSVPWCFLQNTLSVVLKVWSWIPWGSLRLFHGPYKVKLIFIIILRHCFFHFHCLMRVHVDFSEAT